MLKNGDRITDENVGELQRGDILQMMDDSNIGGGLNYKRDVYCLFKFLGKDSKCIVARKLNGTQNYTYYYQRYVFIKRGDICT